jgi:small GTP-binding protein
MAQIIEYRSRKNNITNQSSWILLLVCISTVIALADALQAFVNPISTRPLSADRTRATFLHAAEDDDNSNLFSTLQEKFDYEGRILAPEDDFRCGFVSLIGAANMGKSTLLNALLEETLCTTTHRPQTTRHSILGVLTSEEQQVQLCFLDTPGVIEDPSYKLQEGMMEAVQGAFRSSDVILVITDMFSTPIPNDELFKKLNLCDKKKIVVINKIDLSDKVKNKSSDAPTYHNADDEDAEQLYERTITVEDAVRNWRNLVPDAISIIPMSASEGPDNKGVVALRSLLFGGPDVPAAFRDLGKPIPGMFQPGVKFVENEEARKIIPSSPPLYDPETLTDRNTR